MFNHSEKIDVKDYSRWDAEEHWAKKRKNTHSKFERFREINKLPYRLTVNIVTVCGINYLHCFAEYIRKKKIIFDELHEHIWKGIDWNSNINVYCDVCISYDENTFILC